MATSDNETGRKLLIQKGAKMLQEGMKQGDPVKAIGGTLIGVLGTGYLSVEALARIGSYLAEREAAKRIGSDENQNS